MQKKNDIDDFLNEFTALYPTREDVMQLEFELGIDEAGRGPVMGAMVYSALWWPKIYKQKLGSFRFADSKTLTEQKRQQLFAMINKLAGTAIFYELDILSAQFLSNKQQAYNPTNLNVLSHNSAVKLVRSALSQGFKVVDIYADTVGDPGKYTRYMKDRISQFPCVENVTIQPKADRDFKVVSASSICAKVTRDTIIHNWKFPQKKNFEGNLGSGYPGDPETKKWLQNNKHKVFGFPNFIRFSWSTCSNILNDGCVLKVDEQEHEKRYTKIICLAKVQSKDLFSMIK